MSASGWASSYRNRSPPDLRSPRTIPRDNGIATLTAELDEDSASPPVIRE